ncbi:hypothetical protein V3528_17665, partial [Acinetobacter johnsonii]|uniref:hypothetical protein n=1 Tax=Acinetobacter johnsonii TaxID=40214 RepID=UPI0030F5F15B
DHKMSTSRVSNWANFIASELTINELELFEKMLKKIIKDKKEPLFAQPLTINHLKFKGINIDDSDFTIRVQKFLISRKYKTLERVAKLTRNQLIALNEYGLDYRMMNQIIDHLADDKTSISEEAFRL